jgi:hypothetical protein
MHRDEQVIKVRQTNLSELRHRDSCLGVSLAEPTPLVFSKEGRSQHEMVLFFKALASQERESLGAFLSDNGLSSEQNQRNLKAVLDYLETFGGEALGLLEKIRPVYEKGNKMRMLKRLDKQSYGVELNTEITEVKDFDIRVKVNVSFTYHCQDAEHERCGLRTIEVKSTEGEKIYLKIGDGPPVISKSVHGVVYADANTELPKKKQDGLTWQTAFGDLQAAMDLAGTKARPKKPWEVWATDGVYYPTIDEKGNEKPKEERDKTFVLRDWVSLHGGFAGHEQNKKERRKEGRSILEGDLGRKGYSLDNAFNVVTINDVTAALSQVTIRNGKANSDDCVSIRERQVHDAKFNHETQRYDRHHEWNSAFNKHHKGAGIYARNGNFFLWTSDVVDNWASFYPSAIYVRNSKIKITDAHIESNFVDGYLYVLMLSTESFAKLAETIIKDNKTDKTFDSVGEKQLIFVDQTSHIKVYDGCVFEK